MPRRENGLPIVSGPQRRTVVRNPLPAYFSSIAFSSYELELDFGNTPVDAKYFSFSVPGMSKKALISCQTAYDAPTGKDLDELTCDVLSYCCQAMDEAFSIYAHSLTGRVVGKFKVNLSIGS